MLARPFHRLVLAFGNRALSQRTMVEELIMGILMLTPLGILCGLITIRLAVAGNPWKQWIRSDVWHMAVMILMGDLLMDVFLPSLRCHPPHPEDSYYSWEWLQQTWGWVCPEYDGASGQDQYLLSPGATGMLFALRLLFFSCGVYLGESFVPIALTGGIACGKSTVSELLVHPPSSSKRHNKDIEVDGTVYMIDTDSIAHLILLPADRLKDSKLVSPQDSIYETVLEAFHEYDILEDEEESDGESDEEEECRLIDRRKLGAVVFQNTQKRRLLNRLTHPRIMLIMIRQIIHGIYRSKQHLCCADVPLLMESGHLRWLLFGVVICVVCDSDLQLKRLQTRNPDLSMEECRQRIASQMSLDEKVKKADLVIWNNGSMEDLENRVEEVRQEVMGRVYGIGMSLLQMLLLIGSSVFLAVLSKLYSTDSSVVVN